jgi:hypothetical protein
MTPISNKSNRPFIFNEDMKKTIEKMIDTKIKMYGLNQRNNSDSKDHSSRHFNERKRTLEAKKMSNTIQFKSEVRQRETDPF